MSLRKPDTNELNQTLAKIDQLYIDLVSNFSRSDPLVAATASKNKVEFDVCKGDWLAKHSKATTSVNLFRESSTAPAYAKSSSNRSRSSVSSKSSKSSRSSKTSNSLRSSKSIALSVKRINAQLELEAAKLQADHLKDRIEEQSKLTALKNSMRQSESRRKIELAKQRCNTLSKIEEDFSTSLGIFSPKVSKGVNTSHSCLSLSDSAVEVSIGQSSSHLFSTAIDTFSTSQNSVWSYPKTSTVSSTGRYGASQRPELVSGLPLSSTSSLKVNMGRFNSYQQPGKVERPIEATPNPNVDSISRVCTHSTVSIGQSVLDQQFDSVVSQRSLAPSKPPAAVSWQGAGASFFPANRVDSDSARTMISTVHSSNFHSNHSGFLSSTFNAPAYGNSQAIYTHAGSSLQAPATNPSSNAF